MRSTPISGKATYLNPSSATAVVAMVVATIAMAAEAEAEAGVVGSAAGAEVDPISVAEAFFCLVHYSS